MTLMISSVELEKLSMMTTSSFCSNNDRTVWDPIYPAPPVTNIVIKTPYLNLKKTICIDNLKHMYAIKNIPNSNIIEENSERWKLIDWERKTR